MFCFFPFWQDSGALRWVSDELKGDRELLLQAVSVDGDALRWASEKLKGDREIVLEAFPKSETLDGRILPFLVFGGFPCFFFGRNFFRGLVRLDDRGAARWK